MSVLWASLVRDQTRKAALSIGGQRLQRLAELIERAGTQGIELLNWLVARGALPRSARKLHSNYHIPISNTASGLMLLAA